MQEEDGTCATTGPRDADEASSLCIDCAMCCDGTLFPAADIPPDEVGQARDVGLDVVPGPAGPTFPLPCRHLQQGRCSVYAARPSLCSAFRCRLLIKLTAGAIDLSQARATVAQARRLQATAVAAEPAGATAAARIAWRQGAAIDDGTRAARDPAALLASMTLDWYLDRHFRPKAVLVPRRASRPGSDA